MIRPELQAAVLGIVARFEGSADGRINVYDGQLLSVGSIHYALLSGSCHTFLAAIAQRDPAGFTRCLGPAFLQAVRGGRAATVAWVRTHVTLPSNANGRVLAEWQAKFTALSRLPAYAVADAQCARPYFETAARTCARYRLRSERAYAWAFDRAVQQGGRIRPEVDAIFRRLPLGQPEYAVMKALSQGYAATAAPRWASNVRNRAVAMALGGSAAAEVRPNGVAFSLHDLGISPSRPFES